MGQNTGRVHHPTQDLDLDQAGRTPTGSNMWALKHVFFTEKIYDRTVDQRLDANKDGKTRNSTRHQGSPSPSPGRLRPAQSSAVSRHATLGDVDTVISAQRIDAGPLRHLKRHRRRRRALQELRPLGVFAGSRLAPSSHHQIPKEFTATCLVVLLVHVNQKFYGLVADGLF